MADSLKVFQNTTATPTASNSALSIPVLTTNAGESANIKDVRISKQSLTDDDLGFYKYPTVLKVDGNAITNPVDLVSATSPSVPLELTGSQIVDSSSSVTLEIQAEAGLTDYGIAKITMDGSRLSAGGSGLYAGKYSYGGTSPKDTDESTIASTIESSFSNTGNSNQTGYSGVIKNLNGTIKQFYTNGSSLRILDENGVQTNLYSWGTTVYFIAVDDTYVYGITTSNNTQILRYNHTTNSAASQLTTNQNTYAPTSNNGFIDYYDGTIYLKETGSGFSYKKINTSTGNTVVDSTFPFNDNEFLGGIVTVNVHGVPVLITYGDTSCAVQNLNTGNWSTQTGTFPSNPTTVANNSLAAIGYGLALINNGSYDQSMIIDANGFLPDDTRVFSQHLVTNDISLPTQGRVFIGGEFKEAPTTKERNLDYNLFAAGVLTTP